MMKSAREGNAASGQAGYPSKDNEILSGLAAGDADRQAEYSGHRGKPGFSASIGAAAAVLTEGAVIERIRRADPGMLDRDLLNARLVYSEAGSDVLAELHRQYLDIGYRYRLPLLTFTDTWRANRERLEKAGMSGRDVNGDCVRFLRTIIDEYGAYGDQVYLCGLLGPRGDAYKPEEALSSHEAASFHRYQVDALAAAGVDVLFAATIPSLSEAVGMAGAMARTGIPHVVSFILDRRGRLLDGTAVGQAIREIDSAISPAPSYYMANCCHASFFAAAMQELLRDEAPQVHRMIGLQANTSAKDACDLDGSACLDSAAPLVFAHEMLGLHREFGAKILGGCCGTDDRHIAAIAEWADFAFP